MSIRDGKLLYHLTSKENLESIILHGLFPRNMLSFQNINFEDVADPEILTERDEYDLANYIPFHFYPKNPFDYVVQTQNSDTEFIYICLHRNTAEQYNCKILPKHPLAAHNLPTLYNYSEGLDKIDWSTMDEKDYTDPSNKTVCLAEVLFPESIPASLFQSIVVRSDITKKYVKKMLQQHEINSVYVDVKPSYFF